MKKDAVAPVALFENEESRRGMEAAHESFLVEATKSFLKRRRSFVFAQDFESD
jgi:hypothetical protein